MASQIQHYIKLLIHCEHAGFITDMQRNFKSRKFIKTIHHIMRSKKVEKLCNHHNYSKRHLRNLRKLFFVK